MKIKLKEANCNLNTIRSELTEMENLLNDRTLNLVAPIINGERKPRLADLKNLEKASAVLFNLNRLSESFVLTTKVVQRECTRITINKETNHRGG